MSEEKEGNGGYLIVFIISGVVGFIIGYLLRGWL